MSIFSLHLNLSIWESEVNLSDGKSTRHGMRMSVKDLFTPNINGSVIDLCLYHSHQALVVALTLTLKNGSQIDSKASMASSHKAPASTQSQSWVIRLSLKSVESLQNRLQAYSETTQFLSIVFNETNTVSLASSQHWFYVMLTFGVNRIQCRGGCAEC